MLRFASRKRVLAMVALTAAIIAISFLAAPPASAGSNSGNNQCVRAYNYVNSSGNWFYASTSDRWGNCSRVTVSIWEYGSPGGYFGCIGFWRAAFRQEYDGYVNVSYSGSLAEACSDHQAWVNGSGVSWVYGIAFNY